MREWLQDARYAIRVLAKAPGFSAVAILSLALGIGANTAVFGVARAVLLEPLPVDRPDELRLAYWWHQGPRGLMNYNQSSYRDEASARSYSSNYPYFVYRALRDAAADSAEVFGFNFIQQMNVAIEGRSIAATGVIVSGNYFTALGVRTVLGRPLTADDDRPAATPVAVISHGFWTRTFGADPDVLNRPVTISGHQFVIVGVTAPGFFGLSKGGFFPPTDVTVPLSAQPLVWSRDGAALFEADDIAWVRVMVRLRTGADERQVQQELEVTLEQQTAGSEVPALNGIEALELRLLPGERGLDSLRRSFETPLLVLTGVVGLVILIACVNLAGLVFARGVARHREYWIRLALGSGRLRLARQVFTESLVLALAGGALGAVFAVWAGRVLIAMLSANAGRIAVELPASWTLLGTAAAVSVVAGLLFGLLPALRLSRADTAGFIRPTGIGTGAPRLAGGRLLVAVQIAVSVPLLVGAMLLLQTVANLGRVELGFNPRGLVLFRLDPSLNAYPRERTVRIFEQVLERLERIPGVSSATLLENALVSGWISNTMITVDGGERKEIHMNRVGPRFFETMGMTLVAGRDLGPQDGPNAPLVAVINETAAREHFGQPTPVGRHFQRPFSGTEAPVEVVGIVRDSKYDDLRDDVPPTMFLPWRQSAISRLYVAVRAAMTPGMTDQIRAAVADVDATVPVTDLKTQVEQIDASIARERVFSTLLASFGVFALLLAAIGLHGVTSYAVARRTSEIGVRLALGATRGAVLWMVLRQVLLLAAAGLVIGVPLAIGATRVVRSMLFGVGTADPLSLAAAAVALLTVAAVSGLLPARRAARLDPIAALRHE